MSNCTTKIFEVSLLVGSEDLFFSSFQFVCVLSTGSVFFLFTCTQTRLRSHYS